MKKIFLAAAVAAFAITGCATNEPVDQSLNNAIQFKTLEVGSRAAEKGLSTLQNDGFTAFAYYSSEAAPTSTAQYASQYMGATAVSFGTEWTYSPLKFWPTDGKKLVFYAYDKTPTFAIGDINDHADNPAAYTAPEAANAGIDVLVAKTDAINTPTQKVVMNFHHALSQVVVSAKVPAKLQSLEFNITGIRLTNLKPDGEVSLLAWTPVAPDAANNTGNGLAWTTDGDDTDYVLGLNTAAATLRWSSEDTYTNITSNTGGIFVIPQQLTPGAALRFTAPQNMYTGDNAGTYLEVTYSAKDIESNWEVQSTVTAIPLGQLLQPGLKYHICLTLNGSGVYGPTTTGEGSNNPDGVDNILPIEFDATVVEWVISPLELGL